MNQASLFVNSYLVIFTAIVFGVSGYFLGTLARTPATPLPRTPMFVPRAPVSVTLLERLQSSLSLTGAVKFVANLMCICYFSIWRGYNPQTPAAAKAFLFIMYASNFLLSGRIGMEVLLLILEMSSQLAADVMYFFQRELRDLRQAPRSQRRGLIQRVAYTMLDFSRFSVYQLIPELVTYLHHRTIIQFIPGVAQSLAAAVYHIAQISMLIPLALNQMLYLLGRRLCGFLAGLGLRVLGAWMPGCFL